MTELMCQRRSLQVVPISYQLGVQANQDHAGHCRIGSFNLGSISGL